MQIDDISDLARLHSVLSERKAKSIDAVDGLGLLLEARLGPPQYRQTPRNCVPFASTGGDGVHYSFADIGQGIGNASPIVMTVPMQFDAPNVVVGRDLKDFLALGLRTGYFVLEGLQYIRAKMLDVLSGKRFQPGLSRMEIASLKAIERKFTLKPWTAHEQHLKELEVAFGSSLIADD